MKCPACGLDGTESAKFCKACGTRIKPKPTAPRVILCSGIDDDGNLCGAELTANQKFCENCGLEVDPILFKLPSSAESQSLQLESRDRKNVPNEPLCLESANVPTQNQQLGTNDGTRNVHRNYQNKTEKDDTQQGIESNLDIKDKVILKTDTTSVETNRENEDDISVRTTHSSTPGALVLSEGQHDGQSKIETFVFGEGKTWQQEKIKEQHQHCQVVGPDIFDINTPLYDCKDGRISATACATDSVDENNGNMTVVRKETPLKEANNDVNENTDMTVDTTENTSNIEDVDDNESLNLVATTQYQCLSKNQKRQIRKKRKKDPESVKEMFVETSVTFNSAAEKDTSEQHGFAPAISSHPTTPLKHDGGTHSFETVTESKGYDNVTDTFGTTDTDLAEINNNTDSSLQESDQRRGGSTSENTVDTHSSVENDISKPVTLPGVGSQNDGTSVDIVSTKESSVVKEQVDGSAFDRDQNHGPLVEKEGAYGSLFNGDPADLTQVLGSQPIEIQANAAVDVDKKENDTQAPQNTGPAQSTAQKDGHPQNASFGKNGQNQISSETDNQQPDSERYNIQSGSATQSVDRSGGNEHVGENGTVPILFHVIVSPDFKFNLETDKLTMRGGISGDWNQGKEMKVNRHFEDGSVEFTLVENIPIQQTITYKYCICSSTKGNKKHYSWENYVVNRNWGMYANRTMTSPKDIKNQDMWYQYDGYIEKKPAMIKGLFNSFTWQGDFVEHAKQYVKLMYTSFVQETYSQHVILKKLGALIDCVRRVYFRDNHCWGSEHEFRQKIGIHIIEAMVELSEKAQTTSGENDKILDDREIRILSALAVVCFAKHLNIDVDDKETVQWLFRTLIMKPDADKQKCNDIQLAEKYFENREELLHAIVSFTKKLAEKSKDPSWIILMPWIHFLGGSCKPYETPSLNISDGEDNSKWWGIEQIGKDAVDYFKGKTGKLDVSFSALIEQLSPLFELDLYLPRVLMAAVNLSNLKDVLSTNSIPRETCLSALVSFVKTHGHSTNKVKMLKGCLDKILEQIPENENSYLTKVAWNGWDTSSKLASKLAMESTAFNKWKLTIKCYRILAHCTAELENASNHDQQSKDQIHCIILQSIEPLVRCFNNHMFIWNYQLEQDLKVTNEFFIKESWKSEVCKDLWNREITAALSDTLGNLINRVTAPVKELVECYCRNIDSFHPCMKTCLTNVAFKAIPRGYTIDRRNFKPEELKRYGILLSNLFTQEWKNNISENLDDVQEYRCILHHVLHWEPYVHFLTLYNNEGQCPLSEECKRNMDHAEIVMKDTLKRLMDGTISVRCLKQIADSRFPQLIEHMNFREIHSLEYIKGTINIRGAEINAYTQQAEYISTLMRLCSCEPNVDTIILKEIILDVQEIDKLRMNEICDTFEIGARGLPENYTPRLLLPDIGQELNEELPYMQECSKSQTFMMMFDERAHAMEGVNLSLDTFMDMLWSPVKERWDSFTDQIQTGEISCEELERCTGQLLEKDDNEWLNEVMLLGVPTNIAVNRLRQLQKYRRLEMCVNGASVILRFAKGYGLTGNFNEIEGITTRGIVEMQIKDVGDDLDRTCKMLRGLTSENAKCLDTLLACEPLVKWLKESMENAGRQELKTFVDIALASAGELPEHTDRVQFLHAAVTGYAPLIFDLQLSAGCQELLDKCSLVWKEFEKNPKLPDQLRDTNRCLQWFKDIQNTHGAVEITSIAQAEAVNSCGVYIVGKGAWTSQRQELEDGLSDVLQLTVQTMVTTDEIEEQRDDQGEIIHEEDQCRHYTFSELKDLQSRLMLVAGKDDKSSEEVETFTSVFDSVVRMCKVFIKLCSAGCVLFNEWTAQFICDKDGARPVCAKLEFGTGQDTLKFKGRRNSTEDVKEIIPQVANFMEDCYKEWLAYIKGKRSEYQHLNFFTTDQLVILQRELIKCGTEEDPSHLVYPLLSAVKQNCTPDDLFFAMTEAGHDVETDDKEKGHEETEQTGGVTKFDDVQQSFIEEMTAAGYEEDLATIALQHVSPKDIEEGILWCLDHSEDMDIKTNIQNDEAIERENDMESTHTAIFSGWKVESDSSMQDIIASKIRLIKDKHTIKEDGAKPLVEDLKLLWKEFLESVTSSVKDYLGLEHLGHILQYLATRETCSVQRPFPPCYSEGRPNLVVCPSNNILPMVLSLYMMANDQPLPLPDEVLLCTPQTTVDEVDILWRRALFGDSGKTYCLVNADLLAYEVTDTAETLLEEYNQTGNAAPDYRLVVICGSDRENTSKFVSTLEKHRKETLHIDVLKVKEYLFEKLLVRDQTDDVKPASNIDFDCSTVRLVKSWRSGEGKTLYKYRTATKLSKACGGQLTNRCVSISLHGKNVNIQYVMDRFLEQSPKPGRRVSHLFHFDVAHEVQYGVDYLLFNLLILGCVMDKTGYVWRKSPADLYLIETMPLMLQTTTQKGENEYVHTMLSILPDMTCRSPQESLDILSGNTVPGYRESDQLFDRLKFKSTAFQRTFQYLWRFDKGQQLKGIDPKTVEGDQQTCIEILLKYCGIEDPSWAEMHHFVMFLNTQLSDYENNSFVSEAAEEDLPGFANFVLRFLIQMSRDFSTRSLNMSEETPQTFKTEALPFVRLREQENQLTQYQMRRTWESSPHPYLFFNVDNTFTFLGFNIDRRTGNLVDQQTGLVLENAIMRQALYDSLVRNSAPIRENFDALPRDKKILKLCSVMGLDMPHDPDDTYELTTDNVKKMMAILMRFRCDIPVIIMGETGCGKTRLIKFMCAIQVPPGVEATNMILMKVHGGTTNADIRRIVGRAERMAQKNARKYGKHMFTVLFFDEANTTDCIGLIKEIMCDKTLEGKRLALSDTLKIVAACNPYRKHSEKLIKKLEQAGLGYHVDAEDTTDKLGRVPMRRLVYRVQPLPQSLLPLVWDFGQLNTQVEELYIRQMVRRYIRERKLPRTLSVGGGVEIISRVLTASHEYMRRKKDECSFVSLRDIDRVLSVMNWFWQKSQQDRTLYELMDYSMYGAPTIRDTETPSDTADDCEDDDEVPSAQKQQRRLDDITRSLVLALGVCYHSCLRDRNKYREYVARFFQAPCPLYGEAEQMRREIECCQDVFLEGVKLDQNIARNMALKENVFMMAVCIELRIPLFLVGKPGSSKSLAKTIVSNAMQGEQGNDLFREFKMATMVSFQCSPLATPESILKTFRQCAQLQKDKDLHSFVSVVVLDEIGLAEDSPRMPLKTLHPLLEDGCQGDETPEEYRKVAFIGISNWALDPAKMNRGILVQREVPDLEELEKSARGICEAGNITKMHINPLIKPMAKSYLDVFKKASSAMREFYGLRDFYSLVKMVSAFSKDSRRPPTSQEMKHAIRRNFGGLDEVDPVESFKECLVLTPTNEVGPDCTVAGLIRACLFDTSRTQSESRYLLLLTENYGALTILQQEILARQSEIRPITIFGSSFRRDQEYTQVCRNINKIKVCMETGNTVVLLNLENLYESLYDALNQYYVYFGGERYVDLGLGTHRVKCRVHKNFRLVVVAEKHTVYKTFPIPLINRLEKHILTISNMLSKEQLELVARLEEWVQQCSIQRTFTTYQRSAETNVMKPSDVFVGYNTDTCSAVVLHHSSDKTKDVETVLHKSKATLLWCATPNAVMRLSESRLSFGEQNEMRNNYFNQQSHGSIIQYLQSINGSFGKDGVQLYAQVTTHSKLLPRSYTVEVSRATGIPLTHILLLDTLSSFDTEQQFSNKIQNFLKQTRENESMLVVQCDSGDINANLVACARYCVMDEIESFRGELQAAVHVIFIVQLPNIAGGCFNGFQCGIWQSVHIDELWPNNDNIPDVQDMHGKSPASLFKHAIGMNEQFDNHTAAERMAQPSQEFPDKKVNVQGLVLSSVQAALSMVRDRRENTARTTQRVQLVLELFHQKTADRFLEGIIRLVASILDDKEKHGGFTVDQWLVKEAATNENVHKAGTFRKSCRQALESKIAPILAGIIAYLDTNQNLDVLKSDKFTWRETLWLAVLNTRNILQLKYHNLVSPRRKHDLPEVIVMTTGCEGQVFASRMPFSWLIYQQLDGIITNLPYLNMSAFQGEQDLIKKIDTAVDIVKRSVLGNLLDHDLDNVDEPAEAYISDFVYMVYKVATAEEHEVVCQSVKYIVHKLSENKAQEQLLYRLICVHFAYVSLAQRLVYFHDMNSVWPECSREILRLKRENPDVYMFNKDDLTCSSLCMLLETLSPDKDSWSSAEGRASWLQKVYQYRQVTEKVMYCHEDQGTHEQHASASLYRAKGLWGRIVVLKLFMEHICTYKETETITSKHCSPLWKMLSEETDFKQTASLEKVEKFLKACNKKANAHFQRKKLVCFNCEAVLEGSPVVLPCKDILCDKCVHESFSAGKQCVHCKRQFPKNWTQKRQEGKDNSGSKIMDYQRRCNSFFMDVVSQLCFADNLPPSKPVIDKLFQYVFASSASKENQQGIRMTKELSVFQTCFDPTPVFRSFLLQLLMRKSKEEVNQNLGRYLREAGNLMDTGDVDREQYYSQLCLMIIQCFEDTFVHNAASTKTEDLCIWETCLQEASQLIDTDILNVEKLRGIAQTRAGLAVVAKCIIDVVTRPIHVDMASENLIGAAKALCERSKSHWPRIYLVKYLCRRYGMNAYQAVCQSQMEVLRWIEIQDLNSGVEGVDRFVVCGDLYTTIRETLTQLTIGESTKNMNKLLQKPRDNTEIMLQLAVHREITSIHLFPPSHKKPTETVMKTIEDYLMNCQSVTQKEMMQALLHNKLGTRHLTIVEGETLKQQGVQCIVQHFILVCQKLRGDNTLMQPLISLIKHPEQCQDAFLPTMPQDDLEDVKEALLATKTPDDVAVFYRCPNGHPYVIGDCGRPYYLGKCKCGMDIGGQRHVLLSTNTPDTGTDETATGHLLGRAEERARLSRSERAMTPAYCSCLRLFTNMAMYAGTLHSPDAIRSMIKPSVEEDVTDFLWQHILVDVEDIQRAIGRSLDDMFLLIHVVINQIMMQPDPVKRLSDDVRLLSSKKGRMQWEQLFCDKYLQPFFQDMDATLKRNDGLILKDKRLGSNPLLCMVYETSERDQEVAPIGLLQNSPSVWRYRTPASLELLRQEFEAKHRKNKMDHKVLQLFLREEPLLRALRYVPSILKLHRLLFTKYQWRLDKAEASTISIGQLKGEEPDFKCLVSDFAEAWELVREELMLYLCPTDLGGVVVSKEYCSKSITDDMPIAILLPTTKEMGLCSYALLDFLIRKHNEFLDEYSKITGREHINLTSVSPRDVTAAHLISYDPQQDILPLVIANCKYSFEMGKGTKIEYDFEGLEKQLMDRFLFSKSTIGIGRTLQIDLMVYRADITNALVFQRLSQKIPQECLNGAVKSQVNCEFKSLPDLCTSLDNLDITISFLTSVGGDPQQSLNDFMVNTLKMDNSLTSQKAKQECQLQHSQSLWLLLSLLKSQHIAKHRHRRENVFESVAVEFHEDLTEDAMALLSTYLHDLSIDKLSHLLEAMHEYIVLVVSTPESRDSEDYMDKTNQILGDWLSEYISGQENSNLEEEILNAFPREILMKHCTHTWIEANKTLTEKKTGRQY